MANGKSSEAVLGAGPWSNPLITPEQIELEKLTLAVAASPAVRQAREQARALLLEDATANTADGAASLDRALDQWLIAQVVATVNNDPSRPKLFWAIDNTPRHWFGHVFPGGAVAIDNPDNVNRTAALDGRWSYVLEGKFGKPAAAQTSFNVTGAKGGQLRWGDAIATLINHAIVTDADGRFSVTLDQTPANGRSNHLQLVDGPLTLAVRDSHSDWRQQPTAFTLRVVAGPELLAQKSEQELAEESAAGLVEFVKYWVAFKNTFWNTPPYNEMVGPNFRRAEGGWGTQAGGRFLLEADEALVITTTSGGAEYTGFQISDAWTISPTPIYLTTSRNLTQLHANPDGSYSYVVSLVDPGAANWIDTAGLHDGWFMLRWQNLSADADGAELVKSTRVVKLAELHTALPANSPQADVKLRQRETLDRIAQHKTRSAKV
ncbi:MAG: hypothetical protein JWM78_2145 [Verrucomicrobiaceae bacterium]|nr:hypothetical protein [Verrucomicrobiaceae bacterium]